MILWRWSLTIIKRWPSVVGDKSSFVDFATTTTTVCAWAWACLKRIRSSNVISLWNDELRYEMTHCSVFLWTKVVPRIKKGLFVCRPFFVCFSMPWPNRKSINSFEMSQEMQSRRVETPASDTRIFKVTRIEFSIVDCVEHSQLIPARGWFMRNGLSRYTKRHNHLHE